MTDKHIPQDVIVSCLRFAYGRDAQGQWEMNVVRNVLIAAGWPEMAEAREDLIEALAETIDARDNLSSQIVTLTAERDEARDDYARRQRDVVNWCKRALTAEARITQLEAALKPFADQAKMFDDIPGVYRCGDDVELWQKTGWQMPINVGHLRAARALLAQEIKP